MPFGRSSSKNRDSGGDGPRPLTANAKIFGPGEGEPTYPCKVCSRKFVKASLAKHESACKKLSKPNRKTFDSGVQRAGAGSDISIRDVQKVKKEISKGVFQRPKTHWRERHEEFISNVQSAKGVDEALKTGGPLPPPPKAHVPSDYVNCPHCGRNFNQAAADRHIPFCEKQNGRSGKPPAGKSDPRRGAPSPSRKGDRPSSRRLSADNRSDSHRRASSRDGRDRDTSRSAQDSNRRAPNTRSQSRDRPNTKAAPRQGSTDRRGTSPGRRNR